MQSNFEWDTFALRQCGKIYSCLSSLKKTSCFLPVETKITLFKSLIYPHFIFCDLFLNNFSAASFSRLRVALNACIRFVFNKSRFASVSHLQHRLIGCSFNNFGRLRCCQFMFNLNKTKQPGYLYNKLQALSSTRYRKFVLPRFRTTKYGNSFFVRGVAQWNDLPNVLTLEKSAAAFRRGCNEHFN